MGSIILCESSDDGYHHFYETLDTLNYITTTDRLRLFTKCFPLYSKCECYNSAIYETLFGIGLESAEIEELVYNDVMFASELQTKLVSFREHLNNDVLGVIIDYSVQIHFLADKGE